MPDNPDARGAADGNALHSDDNSPDLVGEELGDGARIWRVYDQVAREEDRERIGTWNRGLDNLALFAGLFSAVTTAFIIQLQQDTQPDYARLTFLVLNASAAGTPFHDEPFAIDRDVRTTNCLWISSLMLSLTAALIAIMGKDWIGMYASRPVCNPRQWAEIRTYRVACVERWYMSGVIASAPVLLHVSFVLFAAGLVVFAAPDPFSQRVALGLAFAAGGLYLVTVLSAIAFPTSPFKSPATQAVRGAISSIGTSVYGRLAYLPKRRPVEMLQRATLLISAGLSYPLPSHVLPLDQSDRRRPPTGDVGMLWTHLFSQRHSLSQSWRDTCVLFARDSWSQTTSIALSFPGFLRSALDKYHYLRQRPRTRPWHVSARSYLRQIDLSDRWAEVRNQPTPYLMAQSLSHLNAMTPSTDVFQSILIALGDIAIGQQVAPMVSFELKSRVTTEIRLLWRKTDLLTLSRYILADRHLSVTRLIPSEALDRFCDHDGAIKSESIVFALAELGGSVSDFIGTVINHYCPDIVIQPRTLQYLLPRLNSYAVAVVLARRYYNHSDSDQRMHLGRELRSLLKSWTRDSDFEDKLHRRFECRGGLLELLVFSLDFLSVDMIKIAFELIFKALDAKEHSCLVYAFGHESPRVANAAWASLPDDDSSTPMRNYYLLETALPLGHFALPGWGKSVASPVSEEQRARDVCLLRTIVMLLFPSRPFHNVLHLMPNGSGGDCLISTLQLCARCLFTGLRHRSALDSQDYLEILTIILDHSVLIRVVSMSPFSYYGPSMPVHNILHILTAIARRLAGLLASAERYSTEYFTGVRLFRLFSFSETTDFRGRPFAWDLGSYLRTVVDNLPRHKSSSNVSMRRLVLALRALRPLCMPHDDLRDAWERIDLPPDADDGYYDSFWDTGDFELGPLLDPDVSQAGTPTRDTAIPPVIVEGSSALDWLDAAMR